MDSKITINIVEPGSGPTPDPVVPSTGLFTHGIGGPEATIIIVSTILVLALVAFVVWYYKKHTNIHLSNIAKHIKSKKSIAIGLTTLAILVSASTFASLLINAGKSNTNAAEGEDGLTLDVSSEDLTIEVGDEPVFAVLPVELTVEEATQAGYTLTAFTDSTDLVSTTDSSKVIPMVTVDEGELAALANNTYGLALDEKPTTKDAEVYMPLSTDSEEPTILKTTDYIETEANDTTTIYYGFYITPDVPYGTYTGTNLNYNVEPHYITNLSFNGNGNDGGVDMEGMTIIAGDTITLPENTFAKEGYNFIGWNTVAEPTEQDPGEAYTDQADYTAVEGETKDVILYAQWGEATLYMQDVAKWESKLEIGDEIIAVDNRDNKEYYVARLADGNIWMTQNLDLDLISDPTAEGYVALTPANTNITADWTPANSTIRITDGSAPGWENNNNIPYSADPGDVYYYTSNTSDNDIQYNSLAECEAAGHTDCAHYHAGNYYNWSAAVANNNTAEITERYTNVETSICPAGWRLPKNRNSESPVEGNEQITQISSYDGILGEYQPWGVYSYLEGGFNAIRTNPLWLARSGYVYNGSLLIAGYYGDYCSSTVYGSSNAYRLGFGSGAVDPTNYIGRDHGYSVRCVAR